VEIGAGDSYFTTTITLNNFGAGDLFDVRYLRNMDPDQEALTQNEFRTINDVLSNPSAGAGEAAVSAKAVHSGVSVALLADNTAADGIEARASAATGLFHRDPYEFGHFETPLDANGGVGNDAITFVFKVDSIAAGATVSFSYITTVNVSTLGNDFLIGGGDADSLSGDSFVNILSGGLGNDTLDGGAGNDVLNGDGGDDIMDGGSGGDTLIGGGGNDSVTYSNAASAVTVDLNAGTASDGNAGTDTISGVENVTGSSHADSLTGDNQNNTLSGGGGGDTLSGGGSNDALIGGAGSDTATYASAARAVNANLATAVASDGNGGTDSLTTI
jgi:Ca2+-binding RTX toxin-like protein